MTIQRAILDSIYEELVSIYGQEHVEWRPVHLPGKPVLEDSCIGVFAIMPARYPTAGFSANNITNVIAITLEEARIRVHYYRSTTDKQYRDLELANPDSIKQLLLTIHEEYTTIENRLGQYRPSYFRGPQ